MAARKDIARIIIPERYAERFNDSKRAAEQVCMTKLTDAQHAARLVCWALDQVKNTKSKPRGRNNEE